MASQSPSDIAPWTNNPLPLCDRPTDLISPPSRSANRCVLNRAESVNDSQPLDTRSLPVWGDLSPLSSNPESPLMQCLVSRPGVATPISGVDSFSSISDGLDSRIRISHFDLARRPVDFPKSQLVPSEAFASCIPDPTGSVLNQGSISTVDANARRLFDLFRLRGGSSPECVIHRSLNTLDRRWLSPYSRDLPQSGTVVIDAGSQLTRIEEGCFFRTSLKLIRIPSSVEVLGPLCFGLCQDLEEVFFAADSLLRNIEEGCFLGCSLRSICIPSSVELLDKSCFSKSQIDEIVFARGSRLIQIGDGCFSGVGSLLSQFLDR
jgi:hypothetical protein